jgi:acyl-CoA reductase-like NAD-dependent aldehyde dehydrogenase
MSICQEEIFGPARSMIVWDDYETMIAQAKGTEYCLAAGIYTSNLQHVMEASARLEAGSVWINRYSNITDGTAFGGYKNSGIGREFCRETLNAYTQIKTITMQARAPLSWFTGV